LVLGNRFLFHSSFAATDKRRPPDTIRKESNLIVTFTFRRLEEGLEGVASRLPGAFKGPDLREGFRKHEEGLKGLEGDMKGA
jgi:hypothetical protein